MLTGKSDKAFHMLCSLSRIVVNDAVATCGCLLFRGIVQIAVVISMIMDVTVGPVSFCAGSVIQQSVLLLSE